MGRFVGNKLVPLALAILVLFMIGYSSQYHDESTPTSAQAELSSPFEQTTLRSGGQAACYAAIPKRNPGTWSETDSDDSGSVTTAINSWITSNPSREIVSFSADYYRHASGKGWFSGVWIVYKLRDTKDAESTYNHNL